METKRCTSKCVAKTTMFFSYLVVYFFFWWCAALYIYSAVDVESVWQQMFTHSNYVRSNIPLITIINSKCTLSMPSELYLYCLAFCQESGPPQIRLSFHNKTYNLCQAKQLAALLIEHRPLKHKGRGITEGSHHDD